MTGQSQVIRVVKIDSEKSWDFFINQATSKEFSQQGVASSCKHILFLSVDFDVVKEVARKMEVKAMPTFLLMMGGAEVDKLVGANPDEIRKRVAGSAHSFHGQ
ncbi:hypothetical protein SADUNF_Sadunf16G0279500 [Salix dunnii]|uniref:Thioredoxin domain-containing protein n=1 Tax=Salix dunnii TaxID=1413687 RepID=A0A835JCL4_9ROSI|nr:hypothetical protein SADUNF_Sadunf16G0279500 [Salix dunnii]